MNLKEVLATYNSIESPDRRGIQSPTISTIGDNYRLRLQGWHNSQKEKKSEKETEEPSNLDEYGFGGFTYQPTETKPSTSSESLKESLTSTKSQGNTKVKSSLKGNSNLNKAINFFADKGFNNIQISGILGNLLGESSLNPKAYNKEEKEAKLSGYGRGIAQWSNSRVKDFKKIIGVDIEDSNLELQLNFAWYEIKNRPALLAALKKSKNLKEATDAIYRGFENGSSYALATPELLTALYTASWRKHGYRPYNFNDELNSRIAHSLKVFNILNS